MAIGTSNKVKETYQYQTRNHSRTGQIAGVPLPNYDEDYVYSKKKSDISDAEYKKQIVAQAYKDYENGQFQNKSSEFVKLMKKYTQEVSPDRKGIITSGLKAISRNKQNILEPIDFLATLLEGKVKYQKLPSGKSEYIEFYDKNGEMVATYSKNGWTMYTTKAEAARQTEMCLIYTAAWRDAKNRVTQEGVDCADDEIKANSVAVLISADGEIVQQSNFDCKA